ncbi:hypothetical protein [Streptomyces sp. TLI_053]|uniref:hypothetical protein n=1 Tax=Streptomyces sp. TLI_053 TaxID=1855352 RepID=UPI000B87FB96|nr:hypothetical protein [Streptomyces sp. TLI_053]
MDLVHPLDGLDALSWSSHSHAYGSAEDLPDMLRALAGADAGAAREALSELYGSVLHQGTVYDASAVTVPFLAGLAAAGHRAADVLRLLGGMAASEDEHEVEPGTVRAAVAARLPLLLPLLAAAGTDVRRAAAWSVSCTRARIALPALHARWEEEPEAAVRAEVLSAIARIDPAAGAALAATALDCSRPAEVRLAAVLAHLDAGAPWTGALHTAMLSLLPADPLRSAFDIDRTEPLAAVVEALLERNHPAEREAALALVVSALRDGRAEVREEGIRAADRACMMSRSAPLRLVPALRAAGVDEASVLALSSLLGRLGPAAEPAADILIPLAGRAPDEDDDVADRALAALVLVAPTLATPFLAAGLARRPRALDAAAGLRSPHDPFPYDPGLLTAVRTRLSRPRDLGGNEPWQLTNLLAGWGSAATEALPELCALLPHAPDPAAPALAAVARDSTPDQRARAAAALRAAAGTGALAAAKALNDLTGDTAPLLHLLGPALRQGDFRPRQAAAAAGELGPRAVALLPELRAALAGPGAGTTFALDTDTALAEALWLITGDANEAVTVLDSVFRRAARNRWSQWSVARAARVVRLLGPAGRPLAPHLEAALADPRSAPAAVLALLTVAEPGTLDRPALAEAALRAAETDSDPQGACEALDTLGIATLTDDQLARLAVLAHGDARTVRSGTEDSIIHQDEALRRRTQALLATAPTTARPRHRAR